MAKKSKREREIAKEAKRIRDKLIKEAKGRAKGKKEGKKDYSSVKFERRVAGLQRAYVVPERKRRISTKKKQVGTTRLLKAAGIIAGSAQQAGPGRPRGSGKFQRMGYAGVHDYRRAMARKRQLYEVYRRQEQMQLSRRGLTKQQIESAQAVRTMERPSDIPQSVADDELQFKKFLSRRTISPNTQRILNQLRRTQLKSESDDVDNQRRLKERRIVAGAGSLLKTPYIFNRYQFNATGVDGDNILKAENVFKEREDNPSILKPQRLNILQTREAGNSLGF